MSSVASPPNTGMGSSSESPGMMGISSTLMEDSMNGINRQGQGQKPDFSELLAGSEDRPMNPISQVIAQFAGQSTQRGSMPPILEKVGMDLGDKVAPQVYQRFHSNQGAPQSAPQSAPQAQPAGSPRTIDTTNEPLF